MKNASPRAQAVFTGHHMLIIMLAFFGIVISVNILLAVMASRTFTGLVVANSYVASQTFDKDTAALAANAAKDVHPALAYANGRLHLQFATAAGAPLAVAGPQLTLGRPVSAATDHVLQFTPLVGGAFVASVNLAPGAWQGNLSVTLPDGSIWQRPIRLQAD